MYLMRFAMRTLATDRTARSDSYRAALDMAEWADTRNCLSAIVSQHHPHRVRAPVDVQRTVTRIDRGLTAHIVGIS
jgi:hypothetical protein